jgi:hypothetical protein
MIHAFCSRLAEAADGVIPGTGVRGDVYVFLPVEKRRWGRSEFNSGWAAPAEIEAVRQARRSGVITRLYNPPTDGASPVLVHRSPEASAEALAALGRLLADFAPHGWPVDDRGAPLLALCTQGTRDRCCAKWGFAVYRAARSLHEEGRLALAPVECSHLGGDRFAATGIAFPSGSMYGHLDRLDLGVLGEAEADGRIVQACYRGRVYESPIAQIVRAGLAREGRSVTATSPLVVVNPQDAPGPLEVLASGERYQVFLSRREIRFFGDCRSVVRERVSRESRLFYDHAQPLGPA